MNYTLITGASKGIGKAFAHECASRGMNLILVARSQHLLEALAKELSEKNISVQIHPADLLDPAAPEKIFSSVNKNGWNVNMLINNAGAGLYGNFIEKPVDKHLEIMHLNMDSMVRMAYEFIRQTSTAEKRYLLNTVSMGAFQPVPYMAVYGATKAFMLSFSRAIRFELRKAKVNVTALCPGGTESEFFAPAGMEKVVEKNAPFMMSAQKVAKAGLNGVLKNKSVVVPGVVNKAGVLAAKLAPHDIVVPVASTFFKL